LAQDGDGVSQEKIVAGLLKHTVPKVLKLWANYSESVARTSDYLIQPEADFKLRSRQSAAASNSL
jgi:hypothetical protein